MGRNYSRTDDPQLSDLSFIWDTSNSDWRLATFSDIFDLFKESYTNVVLEAGSQYASPTTGTTVTVTVNDEDTHLILTPAATLSTLTIELPSAENLRDKQVFNSTCTQVVTTLTVDGNGTTVNGAPTAFAANGYFTLKYDLTLGVWNRIG